MTNRTNTYIDRKNILEYSMAGLGFLLVLSIFIYLIYKTVSFKAEPPQLYLQYFHEPGRYEPHRYHVIVHNKGAETAEAIIIELTLVKGGEELEKSQLDVAFCPKESSREGYVSFIENPAQADTIKARVVSYNIP
ncbi:hypothetical protein [Telluribacter humicola]|uniref:hypothetical protein n=1 Tax=Telluribacter humicola TaxID=1720261 RepID=UPI001A958FDC|nr:hypothetical protein [Telluribacter humicola]